MFRVEMRLANILHRDSHLSGFSLAFNAAHDNLSERYLTYLNFWHVYDLWRLEIHGKTETKKPKLFIFF